VRVIHFCNVCTRNKSLLHLPSATFAILCALNDPWQIEQLYSCATIPDDACARQPVSVGLASRCIHSTQTTTSQLSSTPGIHVSVVNLHIQQVQSVGYASRLLGDKHATT